LFNTTHILNIYRQHVSAFSESQHEVKYKMCTVVLNLHIYTYIYIYIYICFFYSKGMNKKVKMLEHGNMSEFFLSDLY